MFPGLLNRLVSPIARQTPIAVLVAFAAMLSVFVPSLQVTDEGAFLASLAASIVATVVAALLSFPKTIFPRAHKLAGIVPAIDFLAIGLLRYGTGSSASIFTSLLVLPVVWFGAGRGIRSVLYALAGIAIALLTPFALSPQTAETGAELLRLAFSLCTFGTVGTVVHLLSQQAWTRVRTARAGEQRMTAEIDRAAVVQRSLLPQALCAVPGVAVRGTCLPAASVGGDFFDWYRTDRGIAITLGDVMGKGVGAGLIAAAVRAVIRSARADADPSAALHRASEGLSVDSTERDDGVAFTTLFHARLENGILRWADAGHGLAVLIRADGTSERLVTNNLPLGLGIDDDWGTTETRMEPSDLLVCFSDGVLDLFGGGMDTVDRVVEIARRSPEPAAVVAAIEALAEQEGHEDDVTVVALRRDPVVVGSAEFPSNDLGTHRDARSLSA
jgi:hypothetical protein